MDINKHVHPKKKFSVPSIGNVTDEGSGKRKKRQAEIERAREIDTERERERERASHCCV